MTTLPTTNSNQKTEKTERKFNTISCTRIKQRVINVAIIQNEIAFLPKTSTILPPFPKSFFMKMI